MTTEANQRSNVDDIDLTVIFAILWRRRKLIFFGTLAVTLLVAALSFFIPKTYRSEGFYQLGNPEKRIEKKAKNNDNDNDNANDKEAPSEKKKSLIGIPISLYKKSVPHFSNPNRFYLYACQDKSLSKEDLNNVKTSFQTAVAFTKFILPVYTFSKGDIRELVQLPADESNSLLGLNLSYEADSPQKANKFVRFLGQYLQDCLLYVSLYDYVKDEYSNVISELSENENDIIDMQFKLLQNTKKMLDIKAILTKYPEAIKIENRQVVSVQDKGFRFLGPISQLVGIESDLADKRQELAKFEREKEKLIIKREYFSKCNDVLNKSSRQGGMIFSQLKSIKSDVFKNKDFRKGTVKEVVNDLNIDLQVFDLAFFTNCRFILGPTFSNQHFKPVKRNIAIVTCFISFFFFIVLTLIMHWWQSNKKKIRSLNF